VEDCAVMNPPGRRAPGQVLIGATTSVCMTFSTVAGPLLGILASTLIAEFSITRADLGRLAAAYALVGAAFSPVSGRLTDRLGARRMMVLTGVVSALTFVVFASARTYTVLMAAAIVSGIPNGSGNQATNRLIAGNLPPARRGLVTGIKQSGVQAGRFLGGVVMPTSVAAFGLRPSFAAVAALAAVSAVVIGLVLPADGPTTVPATAGAAATPGVDAPLPAAVWWLAAYALLLGAGAGATFAFTALYAQEEVGLGAAAAGLLVGATGGMAMVARIVLSRLAQRVDHHGPTLAWIAVGATVSLVLTAAAGATGPVVLWLAASLAAVTLGSWNSVAMLATMAVVPLHQSGRASGRVMVGFLGGLGLTPPLFGAAVDRVGSYTPCWIALAGVSAAAAVAMVVWSRSSRRTSASRSRVSPAPAPQA